MPTVFSYFSEVLAREKRGEHLSWLCMFWMIGGIYASAMAWAIIPHYGKKSHRRKKNLLVIWRSPSMKVKILKYTLKKGLHVCSQNTDLTDKNKLIPFGGYSWDQIVRQIRNNLLQDAKLHQYPYLVRLFKLLKTCTHENVIGVIVKSGENRRCGDLHQRDFKLLECHISSPFDTVIDCEVNILEKKSKNFLNFCSAEILNQSQNKAVLNVSQQVFLVM